MITHLTSNSSIITTAISNVHESFRSFLNYYCGVLDYMQRYFERIVKFVDLRNGLIMLMVANKTGPYLFNYFNIE